MPEDRARMERQEEERRALEAELQPGPCPKCHSPLTVKRGRFGPFIGCSSFPRCTYVQRIDRRTGVKCPSCGEGDVVERHTRRGRRFWGCSTYPRCTYATWTAPGGDTQKKEDSIDAAKN